MLEGFDYDDTYYGEELPEVVVVAPYPDNDTEYDFRGDNAPYENDERDYEDKYNDRGDDDREGTDNGTQGKGNGAIQCRRCYEISQRTCI